MDSRIFNFNFKNPSPLELGDFTPISLIRVDYKVVEKILSESLKLVVGKIFSKEQSAFVKEWHILDGVLIANEVVDFARKRKKNGMIFKLDFEKAYDSVEWDFLLDSLTKMGYNTKWVR